MEFVFSVPDEAATPFVLSLSVLSLSKGRSTNCGGRVAMVPFTFRQAQGERLGWELRSCGELPCRSLSFAKRRTVYNHF